MTLKEFAELCGVQILTCDPGKYGGAFGYQIKNEPRWSCVGLLSEDACYISWMQDRFGELAASAISELLMQPGDIRFEHVVGLIVMAGDTASTYGPQQISIPEQAITVRR